MKFFLDTANLDEIRKAAALGLADGVTTNPTLISKEGNVDFKQHIAEIYDIYEWKTEVLAASLRHPIHVIEAARLGSDIATMPYKVFEQLLKHPLTDKGQEQFLADWKKTAAAKA